MTRLAFAAALLALLVGCISPPASPPVRSLTAHVVAIQENGRTNCSGVAIAPARVLTARHCLRPEMKVKTRDGRILDAELERTIGDHDVATLVVKFPVLIPAVLGTSSSVEVGDHVVMVGHPLRHEWSITFGRITATGVLDDDFPATGKHLQTTAMSAPGSSGGPLFDSEGRVIGILSFGSTAAPFDFSLEIDEVKEGLV